MRMLNNNVWLFSVCLLHVLVVPRWCKYIFRFVLPFNTGVHTVTFTLTMSRFEEFLFNHFNIFCSKQKADHSSADESISVLTTTRVTVQYNMLSPIGIFQIKSGPQCSSNFIGTFFTFPFMPRMTPALHCL